MPNLQCTTIPLLPLLFLLTTLPNHVISAVLLPLSTDSRWIVDATRTRVKLACITWPAHTEAAVAEGLSKRPMDEIAAEIAKMGFNCVRLTWPLFLATDERLGKRTVKHSFERFGLYEAISGVRANNPSIVDLPLIEAFQAVVSSLGRKGLMVILDNYGSRPGWCCGANDGEGFFGDRYFNPDVWTRGLAGMAALFKNTTNVVGFSLRNDLRGPRQNTHDWYRYMQRGAEAVHKTNPNVLIIVSGLNYDTDISFLHDKPLDLAFSRKLVFELHWYGFWNSWITGNPNQVCRKLTDNMMRKTGFLLQKGFPLFLSEFGIDQRGTNVNDNRFLNCLMGLVADLDLDWSLWTLAGSYYFREKVFGFEEFYGVLDWNWRNVRNSNLLSRFKAVQVPFRGPGLSETSTHKVIFHPSTGLCVVQKSLLYPFRLTLGPCNEATTWMYTLEKVLLAKGTFFCLKASKIWRPATLGVAFMASCSKWETASLSGMHIVSKTAYSSSVCLDVDLRNNIVTNRCKCLIGDDATCDPASQWFKLVASTRMTMLWRLLRTDSNLFIER